MKGQDLILKWAVRLVAVLLVGALAFIGYMFVSDKIAAKTGSPAGRAAENLMLQVRKKPNNVVLRVRLAEALNAAGRLDEAAEQYRAALKIDKDNPEALAGLGMLAMNQNEWAKAEGYWRKLIDQLGAQQYAAQDQRLEQAYFYLGTSLLEREQYEDAIGALKSALVMRRDASDTYYLLSYAYWKLDIPEKRRENLDAALAFDPTLAEANYDLGTMLLADGDTAGAAEHFRASTDAAKGRTEPKVALEKLGPFEKRMSAARQLLAAQPAKALVEVRIAVALKTDDLAAVKLLAAAYEKTDNVDKARDTWEAVQRMAPNDAEASAALKRLEKVGK